MTFHISDYLTKEEYFLVKSTFALVLLCSYSFQRCFHKLRAKRLWIINFFRWHHFISISLFFFFNMWKNKQDFFDSSRLLHKQVLSCILNLVLDYALEWLLLLLLSQLRILVIGIIIYVHKTSKSSMPLCFSCLLFDSCPLPQLSSRIDPLLPCVHLSDHLSKELAFPHPPRIIQNK